MYGPEYQQIIRDICSNNGIVYKEFDNTCISLTYNGNTQYIWSRRFPQNPASTGRLIDSKCLCSSILHSARIPVVHHVKLYRPDTEGFKRQSKTNQKICEEILENAGGVVIKPNDSYEGKDVHLCFSPKDIEQAILSVFRKKEILAASPFIHASTEYRVFYLCGECLLAYKKIRPFVVGNGISSVADLILNSGFTNIDLKHSLNLASVPDDGEKVEIGWKFNLSRGSLPELITNNNLLNSLYSLATQAAKAVSAQFVTVDLLEEEQTGRLIILELNAGVAMDQFILKHPNGRAVAYNIYERAIRNLFGIEIISDYPV